MKKSVNYVVFFLNLAPYFLDCISEHDLDELNVEIIRSTLYKAYLEDFYKFCQEIGGVTAEVMCDILAVCCFFLFLEKKTTYKLSVQFEADRRAFMITINAFGTALTQDERFKLYPKCGYLYPDGLQELRRADNYDAVRALADRYPVCFFETRIFLLDFINENFRFLGLQIFIRRRWNQCWR